MRRNRAIAFVAVLALFTAVGLRLHQSQATLPSAQFTGRTQEAYKVAEEMPELLRLLPCFCGCMDNLGHSSNLDCFRDLHGEVCSMCQNIAIEARDLKKQGLRPLDIRERIIAKYGPEHAHKSASL